MKPLQQYFRMVLFFQNFSKWNLEILLKFDFATFGSWRFMCLMELSDLPQLKTNISKFQFPQKSGEPLRKCASYLYL